MSGGIVSLVTATQALDALTDDERAALRASRFHSAPASSRSPDRRCRLAHPGGALATNKAAALAKFLKRKLKQDGAASLDPDLVESAVENAKAASRSEPTVGGGKIRHVDSFSDTDEVQEKKSKIKKQKHRGGVSQPDKKKNKKMTKLSKGLNVKQTSSSTAKGEKKKKKRSH